MPGERAPAPLQGSQWSPDESRGREPHFILPINCFPESIYDRSPLLFEWNVLCNSWWLSTPRSIFWETPFQKGRCQNHGTGLQSPASSEGLGHYCRPEAGLPGYRGRRGGGWSVEAGVGALSQCRGRRWRQRGSAPEPTASTRGPGAPWQA